MKYLVAAKPGPLPPTPEQFDAGARLAAVRGKLVEAQAAMSGG